MLHLQIFIVFLLYAKYYIKCWDILVSKNELDFCCHRACSLWSFTGWTIVKIQGRPSLCAPHILKCFTPRSWNWGLKWAKILLKVSCISVVLSVFQLLKEK